MDKYEGVLKKVINTYGIACQKMKAIEEMSELTYALCRDDNIENIAEEIGDVRIMLDQLILLYGVEDEVEDSIRSKLIRITKEISDSDSENDLELLG